VPSTFTLQDAAALLDAQLSATHEKQALSMADLGQYASTAGNYAKDLAGKIPTSMLVGGGLGLGAGLLGTMSADERRKHWLRNALLGAGLGAGVGGAYHYGGDLVKAITEKSELQKATELADAQAAAAKAAAPPKDMLAHLLAKPFSGSAAPSADGATADGAPVPGTGGATAPAGGEGFMQRNYMDSPITALGSTASGTGVGHLVDKYLQRRVTGADVNRLGGETFKSLPAPVQKAVSDFQSKVYDAQGQGGKMTSDLLTGRPTITTGKAAPSAPLPTTIRNMINQTVQEHTPTDSINWPGASSRPDAPVAAKPQPATAPAPAAGGIKLKPVAAGAVPAAAAPTPSPAPAPDVTPPAYAARLAAKTAIPKPPASTLNHSSPFTQEQWKNSIVPAVQSSRPRGYAGKIIGGAVGLGATPLVNSGLNYMFGPAPVVPE